MKTNIINKIIIGLIALCLIGCAVHQPVSAPTAAASADTVTFSGKIITDGGRSAGANISIDKLDLSVTATYDAETKSGEVSTNKTTWSITLPKNDAKWKIEIKAKLNSTLIYSGTTDVSADGTVSGDCNITVYFKSDLLRGTSGSISLPFTDDSGKISKVIMKTVSSDPDIPTVIDASADFDSTKHTAILNATIPTGQYTKTFDFCDALGNVLYQCREIITVLADCTTDTWFGASSHIQNGEFKITSDLIDHYGTEIVPRTSVVLYENTTDQLGNYITRYWLDNTDSSVFDGSSYAVSFCFDNLGDVYVLKSINETEGKTTIWSNRNGFGENNEKTVSVKLDGITIDRKNGNLYGTATAEEGQQMRLYDIINDMENMTEYRIACDYTSYFNTSIFTVNDDELFIPYCYVPNEDVIDIYIAKKSLLSAEECTDNVTGTQYKAVYIDDEFSDDEIINITPNDITFTNPPIITDVLYQDGCLYVLLKEHKTECSLNNNDDYLSSRGAVIKYDIFNKETKSIGWTSVPLFNDSVYFYENYKIDNAEYRHSIEDVSENMLSFYAPSNNNEGLYGASRFLGIRPKKLVISDEGYAFYTDNNEACCISNVNRIVTIDLEDFVFECENDIVRFETDGPGSDYISLGYFDSIGEAGAELVIPVK